MREGMRINTDRQSVVAQINTEGCEAMSTINTDRAVITTDSMSSGVALGEVSSMEGENKMVLRSSSTRSIKWGWEASDFQENDIILKGLSADTSTWSRPNGEIWTPFAHKNQYTIDYLGRCIPAWWSSGEEHLFRVSKIVENGSVIWSSYIWTGEVHRFDKSWKDEGPKKGAKRPIAGTALLLLSNKNGQNRDADSTSSSSRNSQGEDHSTTTTANSIMLTLEA